MNLVTDGFTQPEGAIWVPIIALVALLVLAAIFFLVYDLEIVQRIKHFEDIALFVLAPLGLVLLAGALIVLPGVTNPVTHSNALVETPSDIVRWNTADAQTNGPVVDEALRERYGIDVEQYHVGSKDHGRTVSSLVRSTAPIEDVTFYGRDKAGQVVKCKVAFDGPPTIKGRPAHPVCAARGSDDWATPKAIH